ncbi:MAG: Lrp/AsnC family transcriptional regulator, partial [Syntrophales bacterium]|nr:Lrp/AsnC family transcriptional regulator [Syntrophales bacterium]
FIGAVNAIPGVTHNYRRSHDWNVWFTLIAPSGHYIKAILENLRKQTGVKDIKDMKAVRTFKISATFDL